ncbi:vitellogenin-2-like [Mangifera indica]|uniref:vitellogenin-2-like n=1 Tax=Mangifera indica TaxID=29780 RepID=UPI001CFA2EC1|nr:vitellogenin-2-like [Mangifera indica]
MEGGGRVGVGVVEDDTGDGMQCSDHPYRNNPGGICAYCLQEKLGKLVSSSFPLPVRGSSSSSSSPPFSFDISGGVAAGAGGCVTATSSSSASLALSLSVRPRTTSKSRRNDNANDRHCQEYYTRRARIPFLLAKKKKKIMVASSDRAADIVFKRSKSTATPRRGHLLDADEGEVFSPRKRGGFWSFLYHSSLRSNATKKADKISTLTSTTTNGSHVKSKERGLGSSLSRKSDIVVNEEDDSPNGQATASASSFERKVSRSRSLGCGSRSFSGDFFERISTGFGDCTLRRVESQREGKHKVNNTTSSHMKERVKCGGIFGGFIMTSSSSSSSSSSYWLSSSAEDHVNGKPTAAAAGPLTHGRSKSWGRAFASPMRAFTKPSSKHANKNTTPNLAAIPSLLAVRG